MKLIQIIYEILRILSGVSVSIPLGVHTAFIYKFRCVHLDTFTNMCLTEGISGYQFV